MAFTARDITQDPSAIRDLQQMGAMGTPVVVVNGEPVHGFNRPKIDELLGRTQGEKAAA